MRKFTIYFSEATHRKDLDLEKIIRAMDSERVTLKGMALYVESPRGRKPMRKLLLRVISKKIRVYADGKDYILRARPEESAPQAAEPVMPTHAMQPLAPRKRWAARGARQKRRRDAAAPPPAARPKAVLRSAAEVRGQTSAPTPPSLPRRLVSGVQIIPCGPLLGSANGPPESCPQEEAVISPGEGVFCCAAIEGQGLLFSFHALARRAGSVAASVDAGHSAVGCPTSLLPRRRSIAS